MSQPLLRLDSIRVGYPAVRGMHIVVDDLSLALGQGEIGCLLGSSGCGKTTALRAIAGFEPLLAGRISLAGEVLSTASATLAPERRGIGLMFQDYALFPHLDVAGNIGFGLATLPAAERASRIAQVLELVGLQGSGKAYPHELSGGQQQRIALARALAPSPRLLLLDEPFSNLDVETRERLAQELRDILKAAGIASLLVTHDQAEAFAMADRIGVMDRGRILQWADAATLYLTPADRVVAAAIGRGSVVPAAALGLPGQGEVLLRPHQLRLDPDGPLRATLLGSNFRGPSQSLRLKLADGSVLEADLAHAPAPADGAEVRLSLSEPPTPIPATR